jgi:asparagine synthase (glutamine-hydrolysing)
MIGSLLTNRMRSRLRPLLGARRAPCPWIAPAFARRVGLAKRLESPAAATFPTREQQDLYNGATSLPQILGDEMEDRAARAYGIEHRHPFYDRRLAEFALALPSSQRARGRQDKVLVRTALREHLPQSVAAREDKAEFSSTYVQALEAIGGRELFARMRSEDAGWVDGKAIRKMYDDMIQLYSRGTDAYIASTGPLWAVAALEVWLDRASTLTNKGVHVDRSA